jgi:hypothetical protein
MQRKRAKFDVRSPVSEFRDAPPKADQTPRGAYHRAQKKPGSDGSQGGKGLLSLPGAIGSIGRAPRTRVT